MWARPQEAELRTWLSSAETWALRASSIHKHRLRAEKPCVRWSPGCVYLGVCFSDLFTICVCQVSPSIRWPEQRNFNEWAWAISLGSTTLPGRKIPKNFWHARSMYLTALIFPKILGPNMEGQFGQNINKAENPFPLYPRWWSPNLPLFKKVVWLKNITQKETYLTSVIILFELVANKTELFIKSLILQIQPKLLFLKF